jgi:hypothetical protein
MKISKSLWVVGALLAGVARADVADLDGAYLDKPYRSLRRIEVLEGRSNRPLANRLSVRSDTSATIERQTPVKAQGQRGTCSIFSATAMLEAALVRERGLDTKLDLSEEWLEYLIMRQTASEGSTSDRNFRAFSQQGTVEEEYMPYIGETWESLADGLARERCGTLSGFDLSACLLGHRNPNLLGADERELENPRSPLFDKEFLAARTRAREFRAKFLDRVSTDYYVSSNDEVRLLLQQGVPVTLDIDFYYGAWNHRVGPTIGIERDETAWARGEVGYPEPGSVDRAKSHQKPAGHSVVLVGYDDEATLTTRVRMSSGRYKTFTYKGVYYFKNSWGTGNFGAEREIDGKLRDGYGAITYKYAHEYGGFYKLPLK